jgi:hypothetical protein
MDRVTEVPAFTPLQAWAGQAHEIFIAMQEAGFTADEAITLIVGMFRQPEHN